MATNLTRGEQVLEGFDASSLGAATHRDAALEAAIAEAPDEPEPYLVYADWLQARGDVRGTLIALQDAARHGSRTATAGAAALLESHARTLLGELYMRNDVELEWFQGFIREVRLEFRSLSTLLSALRALFATPAGAFVQAITIDHLEEVERVIAFLIEHCPLTLAHLAIGKPRQWSITPELCARFPRLARDPQVLWTEAVAAASAQKRLSLDFDPALLPALEFQRGIEPAPAATILAGIKAEIAKQRPIGMLAALRAVTSRRSLDLFARSLTEQWEARSSADKLWALEAIGTLGGDECVTYLAARFVTWTHPRAVQALEHLRKIGTDAAITALAGFAANTALPGPRRAAAIATLEEIALTRNVDSLTQLLAQTCPRNPTSFGAQRLVDQQCGWLYDLMINGERMSRGDFDLHVAGHVIRQPLARGLVWGDFAGASLRTAFVIDRFGDLRTREGALHQLPDDARVGVVHPLDVEPSARSGWWLVEEPPFDQLDRPLYALTPDEGARDHIDRYDRRGVGFTRLVPRLTARGWVQAMDDHGACYTREFPRDNAIARVALHGGAATDARVRRVAHWQYRRLDTLHPVTVSELLADLEAFHAR